MLEAKNLVKSFGNLEVLKGVDVRIKEGEIVSITGASGAGKSTLLHIMGTLEKADQGSIFFEDENISEYSPQQLAKFRNLKMGFVFQFHHLLPEFTALENTMLPAMIAGKSKKEALGLAKEMLNVLGLENRGSHKPSEMSGGEQQRISVARALVNRPKVIFADEPTGNLDSKNALALHDLFSQIREKFGTSFIIVTHNETLAQTADRCLHIKDGRIQ